MYGIHKKILFKLFDDASQIEIVDRQGQILKKRHSKSITESAANRQNVIICILNQAAKNE